MKFKSKDWKRAWGRRPAWTPCQLADVSCGLDPHVAHPNTDVYNRVLDEIMLSLNVPDSTLPIIDNPRWPATAADVIYRTAPLLKPAAAYAWAKRRWPKKVIRFSPEDFAGDASDSIPDQLRPFVSGLVDAWKAEAEKSNKELAHLVTKKTGISFRAAEGIVSWIRPKRAPVQPSL